MKAERVVLKILSRPGKRRCVIDGELLAFAARDHGVEIHKKALNVLVPAEPQPARRTEEPLRAHQFTVDPAGCDGAMATP